MPQTVQIIAPRINALLEASLDEIRAHGIEPTDADIVRLYELSRAQVTPTLKSGASFVPPSYDVNGVTFYPLTMQAIVWLDDYAYNWFRNESGWDVLATAWAMAHSGNDTPAGFFSSYTGRRRFTVKISAWFARLPISLQVLTRVVELVLGEVEREPVDATGYIDEKATHSAGSFGWGDYIANLRQAAPGITFSEILRLTESQAETLLRSVDGYSSSNADAMERRASKRAWFEYRLVIREILARAISG